MSTEINTLISEVLNKWAGIIRERVENEHGKLNNINGESHSEHIIKSTLHGCIAELKFWGQKAWIAEFGRGSLGEKSPENPYWDDYINSPIFNQYRKKTLFHRKDMARVDAQHSYPIQAREKGEYIDLDGNVHYASGKFPPGFDLEVEYWINKHDERFAPVEAMHIIKNQIESAIPEILSDIKEVLGQYIINEINNVFVNKKIYL